MFLRVVLVALFGHLISADPKKMHPDESFAVWATGGFQVVIDIRTRKKYEEGHLPGAFLAEDISVIGAKCKKCPIAVYCGNGSMSQKFAEELVKRGFEDVTNIMGTEQLFNDESLFKNFIETGIDEAKALKKPRCNKKKKICKKALPVSIFPVMNPFHQAFAMWINGMFNEVIDVRGRKQYKTEHLPGSYLAEDLAMNVYRDSTNMSLYNRGLIDKKPNNIPAKIKKCKKMPVAVYGKDSIEGQIGAQALKMAGFQDVTNFAGADSLFNNLILPGLPEFFPFDTGYKKKKANKVQCKNLKTPSPEVIKHLTPEEAYHMWANKTYDVLLDVRVHPLYTPITDHIEGAYCGLQAPMIAFEGFDGNHTGMSKYIPDALLPCKKCVIALYCTGPFGAALAAQTLISAGFENVISLGSYSSLTNSEFAFNLVPYNETYSLAPPDCGACK